MSCDVAVAAFLMFASAGDAQPARLILAADAGAPTSVASEPLFHDIVLRAAGLKAQVETWRAGIGKAAKPVSLNGIETFSARIGELSALDENGHKVLVSRGAVDDLKCILHGISQDLPVKLQALKDAKSSHDEDLALRDMAYLLNDNVEVITAPPQPPA